jgi:hypothetical protein
MMLARRRGSETCLRCHLNARCTSLLYTVLPVLPHNHMYCCRSLQAISAFIYWYLAMTAVYTVELLERPAFG